MDEIDLKKPNRDHVEKEVSELFATIGEPVSVLTVEIFAAKMLKYYHQGAMDAYDNVLTRMPKP